MPRRATLALIAFLALLAAPLLAVPEPSADELQASRARLERWRKHPEQLARLRHDLQEFLTLPEDRREQLLQLDHDLHQESSQAQARLWSVLERYTEWLDRLSEADRRAVETAPDKAAKLAEIRGLRDRDWMKGQPRALREQWAKLKGKERSDFVQKLRQEERQRRKDWQVATRFWKELEGKKTLPARLTDLLDDPDKEIRTLSPVLFNEYLMPMLSADEKARLKKAEGTWPGYMQTLIEIADRHPFALPGLEGPRYFHELPQLVQQRFTFPKTKDHPQKIKAAEGRWPQFAAAVVEQNRQREKKQTQNLPLPHELWAYNYQCLLRPMQEYVDKVLRPALTEDEKLRLLHASGNWPQYPQAIQELAQAHHLPAPPWQTALPGPRERWDAYRQLPAP
jgi:hypothetical protein